MHSILHEITTLRGGKPIIVDGENSNRYRVVAREDNGTKTAYCFGVPIYNQKTRRLVDLRFHETNSGWIANGSNAEITAAEDFLLENANGSCRISLSEPITSAAARQIDCGLTEVFPTVNGLFFRMPCMPGQIHEIKLLADRSFQNIRENDRCFSLMCEEFQPFLTVSCIGVLDHAGQLMAPGSLHYQKYSDREFALSVSHSSSGGKALLFEINLHEQKLFQDTTVESLHPQINNAFGGIAFVGETAAYGEQWLYSRLDFSKISELADRQIHRAVLHMPKFGGDTVLTAVRVAGRFCSFGSNWDNKIPGVEALSDSIPTDDYQSLDLTALLTDRITHYFTGSEGLILKSKVKGSGFSAVATGDSYYAPQILEINFR